MILVLLLAEIGSRSRRDSHTSVMSPLPAKKTPTMSRASSSVMSVPRLPDVSLRIRRDAAHAHRCVSGWRTGAQMVLVCCRRRILFMFNSSLRCLFLIDAADKVMQTPTTIYSQSLVASHTLAALPIKPPVLSLPPTSRDQWVPDSAATSLYGVRQTAFHYGRLISCAHAVDIRAVSLGYAG
jgi:hypothetical protein